MDRAVLDAYGWTDIRPTCDFELEWEDDEAETGRRRRKPWRYRWPEPARDEVLARLLALNAQRAEEERRALGDHYPAQDRAWAAAEMGLVGSAWGPQRNWPANANRKIQI